MRRALRFAAAVALPIAATGLCGAATVAVSPTGEDTNPGTLDRPFRTLRRAVEQLQPGDECIVREGVYRETVPLTGIRSPAGAPLIFRALPGETPVLDGADRITGPWRRFRGRVFVANVDRVPWQLFVDGQLVPLARWPNASFADGSIWRMNECMRAAGPGSVLGMIEDADSAQTVRDFEDTETGDGLAGGNAGAPRARALAETGADATGAVAVLNLGHWLTWARRVTEHKPGTGVFRYDTAGLDLLRQRTFRFGNYCLLGLPFLDAENEWWPDPEAKVVYLYAPGGADPAALQVRGKFRDYAVELRGCENVEFRGLRFTAAAPLSVNSSGIAFTDCDFLYPSTHKWALGEFGWFRPHAGAMTADTNNGFLLVGGNRNRFIDCTVAFCNSPVALLSPGILIENCLFHDLEWDLNSNGASGSVLIGEGGIFRRNTVRTGGNSEGVRPAGPGVLIEQNRISHMGLLQHDGAAVNAGVQAQQGCVVRENWTYATNRQGIRFDAVEKGDGTRPWYGEEGVCVRNVMFDCANCQIKGNRHLVLNNTLFGIRSQHDITDMTLFVKETSGGINDRTVTRNNLARLASAWWPGPAEQRDRLFILPGTADHNLTEKDAARRLLRDPDGFDFRPLPGSVLVDAGIAQDPRDNPGPNVRFAGLPFEGAAPDIGACEFGARQYMIPGRQVPAASFPIPPDGYEAAKPDADLMFLEGRDAVAHRIYLGTDPARVRDATPEDGEFAGKLPGGHNILTPGRPFEPGRTFFWRVDALHGDGTIVPGEVWRFRTAD